MGHILDDFGPWCFEVRRASIKLLHAESDDALEWDMGDDPDDDLAKLIDAIEDVRAHIEKYRRTTQ